VNPRVGTGLTLTSAIAEATIDAMIREPSEADACLHGLGGGSERLPGFCWACAVADTSREI
jgi:hypothetical protein